MAKRLGYTYDIYIGAEASKVWKGLVDGEIVEVDAEKRLVMTWRAHWGESTANDAASRVTYELSPAGPSQTRLRLIHDDFDGPTATYTESTAGWPRLLSSLKSLLETGKALAME